MPSAPELLAVARLLLSAGTPTDAQRRRAVSTAYYTVFHHVLAAAAARFMGAGMQASGGYGLLYRGFNHGRMKSVCAALSAPALTASLQQQLGRSTVSRDMRDFLGAFSLLQEARTRADYDPSARFSPSAAADWVETAAAAMAAFDRVVPDEKADVLALMLVSAR